MEPVEALSGRYRAGTEILIADSLAPPVDSRALATLLRALATEEAGRAPYEAASNGWIVNERWI